MQMKDFIVSQHMDWSSPNAEYHVIYNMIDSFYEQNGGLEKYNLSHNMEGCQEIIF